MKVFFITLSILLGLSLGSILGLIILKELPAYPISRKHPINQVLGIWHHETVGFLPYWLLSKADTDYSPYVTTLTYFGLVINPDGTIQKKVNPKENEPGWHALNSGKLNERFTQARQKDINLSLLVHLSNEDDIKKLLEHPEAHAHSLTTDIEPIMKQHSFTDLNVDIESFREASPGAKTAFTTFINTVKQDLVDKQLGTLTIDMSPSALFKPFLYEPDKLGTIVDHVILMTYDYSYTGSWITGPVAPLDGAGETREFDVNTAIVEAPKQIPESKLILGIPFYGYEWETLSPSAQSAVIPGSGRSATHERVMTMLKDCPQCTTGIDVTSQEPYVWQPEGKYYRALFYEDANGIRQKLDRIRYWKGAAIWALGYEGDKNLLEPFTPFNNDVFLVW